jgi:hypothetical protein
VIVGISQKSKRQKYIYWEGQRKVVENINAYLVDGPNIIIEKHPSPVSELPAMFAGNIPRDKGNFMLERYEKDALVNAYPEAQVLVRKILGSLEFINGIDRSCLWISDEHAPLADSIAPVRERHLRALMERQALYWLGVRKPRRQISSAHAVVNLVDLPEPTFGDVQLLSDGHKSNCVRCHPTDQNWFAN